MKWNKANQFVCKWVCSNCIVLGMVGAIVLGLYESRRCLTVKSHWRMYSVHSVYMYIGHFWKKLNILYNISSLMCTYTAHCVWIARFSMSTVLFVFFISPQLKLNIHTHCYAFNGLIHVACVWTALKRQGHSVPYIYKSLHRYIQTYIYTAVFHLPHTLLILFRVNMSLEPISAGAGQRAGK